MTRPSYILPGCAGTAIILALFLERCTNKETGHLGNWISKHVGWISVTYVVITLVAGQFMSTTKSSETILRQVVAETHVSAGEIRTVGVWGTDNLSPFWLSLAGELELGDNLNVEFVNDEHDSGECDKAHLSDILVREESNGKETFSGNHPTFQMRAKVGRWLWFQRSGRNGGPLGSPTNL